jgi:hypothetical protein
MFIYLYIVQHQLFQPIYDLTHFFSSSLVTKNSTRRMDKWDDRKFEL